MVKLPNILITGVPGTGKTKLSEAVMHEINKKLKAKYGESCKTMQHIQVSKLIIDNHLYTAFDKKLNATVFDEDLLRNFLLDLHIDEGGYILDFHDALSCVNCVQHAFVLITRTEVLYNRLVKRNYGRRKIETNMESLIFAVIQSDLEAHEEIYKKENELWNNDEKELKNNVKFICNWILNYIK